MTMLRNVSMSALGCITAMALAVAAQAGGAPVNPPAGGQPAKAAHAAADLAPTQGSTVAGRVVFSADKGGVRVVADITGLTPGVHGFHIHEKGDCSAPDGTSAGGHFNPGAKPHGAPDVGEHHSGDLGNITADAGGKAHLDAVFSFLTLAGADSIVGRGVIVHAAPDDLKTQPTGNAGGRVSCGVIKSE